MRSIVSIALLVRDYDEAIHFFTDCLNFVLVEDSPLDDGKRWVVVSPPGGKGASLLLAKAANDRQIARIGDQTGGRVFLFIHTDDFWGDYTRMQAKGIKFQEEPRREIYGTVVVFQDLYGNKWDLIQPA